MLHYVNTKINNVKDNCLENKNPIIFSSTGLTYGQEKDSYINEESVIFEYIYKLI